MSAPRTPGGPRRRFIALPLSLLAGAVLLVGCTGASAPAAAPANTSVGAPAAVSSPATGAAASTATRKVNPNTASIAEIQQALEANGVPNAARWAREVDEYKPYPTNDPNLGKLRQNLAKYNPAPDVLEKIVASLTLT